MDSDFDEAAAWISKQGGLSNETKLDLYALFKISTSAATPSNSRPAFWDMTGRAKWDAWQRKGEQLSKEGEITEAEGMYVELVKSLGWQEGNVEPQAERGAGGSKGMVSVSTMAVEEEQAPQSGERTIHDMATDGAIAELRARCPLQEVNNKDSFGFTPLHLAADRGHAEVVELLLQQGADRTLQDSDGFTAIELAEVADRTQVVDVLSSQ